MSKDFRTLIKRWPSLSDFAECIGVSENTAKQMRSRNSVDTLYFPKIVEGAEKLEIPNVDFQALVEMRNAGLSKPKQTEGQ